MRRLVRTAKGVECNWYQEQNSVTPQRCSGPDFAWYFDYKYPILWYAYYQGNGRFFLERNFITSYILFSRLQSFGKDEYFFNFASFQKSQKRFRLLY